MKALMREVNAVVKSMVSKGKNIEEAIESALSVMGKDRAQVEIEVIDSGKKRALWSKPAVVKVTYTRDKTNTITATEESWLDDIEQVLYEDATSSLSSAPVKKEAKSEVWIENGKVRYHHYDEKDYPTITPRKEVTLLKNGEETKTTAIIESGDVLTLLTDQEREETVWKMHMDQKKMEATVKLEVGKVKKYEIVDQKPTRNLEVKVKEVEVPENTLKKKDVYQWLEDYGVTEGVNHNAIEEAVFAEESDVFKVAQGQSPIPGTNGDVEFYIDTTSEKVEYKELDDGTVDFKNARQFSNVSRGEVLGKVIAAVPGTPGVDLQGEEVPPPPVHDVKLRLDKSVHLIEPDQLVSLSEGRLDVERRGVLCRVKVVPKLYVNRDVDVKYGNVDYYGDVEVNGSIREFMEVKAKGEVQVQGSIHFSKVESARSIYARRNVIQSNLSAGDRTFIVQEITDDLNTVLSGIKKCVNAAEQLMGVSSFSNKDISKKGLSSLLRLLMEKKLAWVRKAMKRYVSKVKNHKESLEEEWIFIQERLEKGFLLYHPEAFQTVKAIHEFEIYIAEWLQAMEGEVTESEVEVVLPYSLESQIYSSGNIFIKGPGCYNSKLHAAQRIDITGVVRGGYLFASEEVHASETGIEGGGVRAIVGTSKEGVVKLDTVHEDTIVLVGNRRHVFLKTAHNVQARLDEDEELVLF
ncbi:FapA family protein [Salimicrobium halophilum]|nr:FapA family protein [Salimicrobium halophilum]